MPVIDVRTSGTTPILRRAPTGTLHTEIGGSVFYSKSKITQMPSSKSSCSLDAQHDEEQAVSSANALKSNGTISSRFPKLQECAHFHYDRIEMDNILVSIYDSSLIASCSFSSGEDFHRSVYHGVEDSGQDYFFTLSVNSNGKTWLIRRSYRDFRKFDRQLHKCVYDRKFSRLEELIKPDLVNEEDLQGWKTQLSVYLDRFSQIAGNLINCAPVLNWLELDNRGFRLVASDDSATINTPAVAAVHVVKRYVPQAGDELSLEVGDMLSVIDMPPTDESIWWRGKKELDVGFFPSDCVQVIGGGKMPPNTTNSNQAPVLRKRGKLIAFFRSFLSARPSRRRLKESGILKERVYGCDLGEHLLNTGQKVPAVMVQCSSFIEEHMHIVDGIYRLSGITSNIQKLRLEFDAEKVPDLTQEAYMQDIHSVASVLKLYFRELPNPLLTYQLYDRFVEAVQSSEELRLLKIHDVVNQLPPPHFRTLEYLARHLARIAIHSDRTGMNSKNLAIVWAPNLLRSSEVENSVEALRGVSTCAIAVEYLIKYADLIFGNQLHSSSLLTRAGYAAKNNRPKSVAVSTPSKLLSLDEARLLTRPNLDQKYIEVGAGPENVPKYHTVIVLPKDRKKRNNSTKSNEKSSLTWRSIFASKSRKPVWNTNFDPVNPLLSGSSPTSSLSSNKKPKLRAVQSANSLDSPRNHSCHHQSPLLNVEPRSLRLPTNPRTPTSGHSRSFSLDSCLKKDDLDHSPKLVIDVIKTVPYSNTESGCLVKLSIHEEAPEFEGQNESTVICSSFHSTELSATPISNPILEPVRYKKLSRTLSPEFLRKHREPLRQDGVGIKRSLSASPKAGHRLLPALKEVSYSSEIRTSSASGRKSFRRSTSEEDLAKVTVASDLQGEKCLPDENDAIRPHSRKSSNSTSMEVMSHDEGSRPFESTEMELFDDICAEICCHEREVQTDADDAGGGLISDSLQDIADIHEEAAPFLSQLIASAPALVDTGDSSDLSTKDSEDDNSVGSPSSILELRTLFSPHHPVSPKVIQKSASVTSPARESDQHFNVNRSASYFFGQTEAENRRRKLEWFESKSNPDIESEVDFFSDETTTKENVVFEGSSVIHTELPLFMFGQLEQPSQTHSEKSHLNLESTHLESLTDWAVSLDLPNYDAKNDNEPSLCNSVPSFRYTWSAESEMPLSTADKRSSPLLATGCIEANNTTSNSECNNQVLPKDVLSPETQLDSETLDSVPQTSVEYILVLQKPAALVAHNPDIAAVAAVIEEPTPAAVPEVTPPSVRSLRSRFESSTASVVPDTDSAKNERKKLEQGSLKQKLKELSDAYKEPVSPSPIIRMVKQEPISHRSLPKCNTVQKPLHPVDPKPAKTFADKNDAVTGKSLKVSQMRQLFQTPTESGNR